LLAIKSRALAWLLFFSSSYPTSSFQVKVRYVLKKRQDEREWYAAEKERNQRGGGSWGGGWGGGGWGGNSGSLPRLRR